jgi:subtilisin family serine protease
MYSPNPVFYFGAMVSVPGTTGGTVQAWNFLQTSFRSFQVANYNDGDTVMSVNELGGTAKRNITVGSYLSKTLTTQWNGQLLGWDSYGNHGLNAYSGHGPTVDGRIKPDISAPGSNVAGAMPRFITNLSNCVYWPDSPAVEDRYAITGGTSVAAPIVAGIVAMMLQIDSSLTVEQARTYLQETAIVDTFTGPIPSPNNWWGAGKANALGVVAKMLNLTANRRIAGTQSVVPMYHFIRLSGNRLLFAGSRKDAGNDVTIELFSVNGRRIMQQLLGRNNTVVTLAPLSQGVYIVRAVEKSTVLCSSKISVLY